MGNPKQKYCKCGHKKDTHKKNPKSKLSFASHCRKCQCTSYLNRDMPTKGSYISSIIAACMGVTLIVIFSIVAIEANPEITGTQDAQVDMTLGELYLILMLLFLILVLWFSLWFIVDPIADIFAQRKRRVFPIDD